MYLDPGSAGLFIQAIFAVLAAVLGFFSRSRAWVAVLWSRAVGGITRVLRRRNS